MTDTTPTWNGQPPRPEESGWHILQDVKTGKRFVLEWCSWASTPAWRYRTDLRSPEIMSRGHAYIGPVDLYPDCPPLMPKTPLPFGNAALAPEVIRLAEAFARDATR